MAHISRIEGMPRDTLIEILFRVAEGPDGAGDIARAFAVSKTFRNCAVDGYVLRAVSFVDFFPRFAWRLELLSETDGLVVRCSRAGDMNAQFILAKVALLCASKVYRANTNTEPAPSDVSEYQHSALYQSSVSQTKNYYLSDLNKATRFLDHLSAQNTNPMELVVLLRTFLSIANVRNLVERCHQLKDFVALYLMPGKKPHHQQFLTTLDELCNEKPMMLCLIDPAKNFNQICDLGHAMMKPMGIAEKVISPLLECKIPTNDGVAFETLNERWRIIRPILKLGDQVAFTRNDEDVLLTHTCVLHLSAIFVKQLLELMEYEAFVESARGLLLATFDALFDIQQGSP